MSEKNNRYSAKILTFLNRLPRKIQGDLSYSNIRPQGVLIGDKRFRQQGVEVIRLLEIGKIWGFRFKKKKNR